VKKLANVARVSCGAIFAIALTMGLASQAEAQAPVAQPYVSPGNCPLVKNAGARSTCLAARTEYSKGGYRLSLSMMRKALADSHNEPIIRTEIARVLIRMDAMGQAERELRQARQDGAPDREVLLPLFYTMVSKHEETILLNEFPEPAANAKGDAAAAILKGRALAFRSQGQLAPAAAAMDRSLALSRTPDSLLVRADIAGQQKDAARAAKLVDEAFKLAPEDDATMAAKLDQLERANDQAGVLALSYRMQKLYPINSDPREARIRVYLKQNQDAKAKAEIDAFQALRPRSPLMLYYQAVLLARAHDEKGAAQIILGMSRQFIQSHPELAIEMAQIALDGGHAENSAAVLGYALAAAPDMIELRLKLAAMRLAQDSPQSAMLLLGPVKDSRDPAVQKLLSQARAKIDKDRAF